MKNQVDNMSIIVSENATINMKWFIELSGWWKSSKVQKQQWGIFVNERKLEQVGH